MIFRIVFGGSSWGDHRPSYGAQDRYRAPAGQGRTAGYGSTAPEFTYPNRLAAQFPDSFVLSTVGTTVVPGWDGLLPTMKNG